MSRVPFNTNVGRYRTPADYDKNFGTPTNKSTIPEKEIAGRRDYSRKVITNFIFDLTTTFDQFPIDIEGSLFWCSAEDQTATVRVQYDSGAVGDPGNRGIAVRNGTRVGGVVFSKLLITNAVAQAGLTLEIAVTRDYPDDRVDINL